jgi:hypothetical protein
MHSSLSSEANRTMGQKVGVDAYVAKFDPAVLADTLVALSEALRPEYNDGSSILIPRTLDA